MDSELTPDNIGATLEIAPEISAEADAPTGDVFDEEGEPLEQDAEPESDDQSGDSLAAAEAPEETPDAQAVAQELERLRQEKAEFDRLRAELQAQQQEQSRRQAEAFWGQQEAQASQYFAAKEQQIHLAAQQQYDPQAYLRQAYAALNQERTNWEAQYRQTREAALWQFAAQAYVPQYAQEVAQHYGLDAQARQELMQYQPDDMPRMAAVLQREQRARQIEDQARRSVAAQKVAASTPRPGGGNATGGRIRAGSRAHLLHLLNSQ